MAYVKRTWVDRQTEYPGRRKLSATGVPDVYDVVREEGLEVEAGDALNAQNLNDLEGRIETGLAAAQQAADSAVVGLEQRVPVSRKVNGKVLTGDISLAAGDVGAVPIGRKVNGKVLSADISLTAGDVGAATASHTHTPASIGAATAAEGVRTLTHSKSGSTHLLTGLGGATGILSARFKATAAFVAGNTFTVDGTTYTATLASGDSLPDNAFVSGALVEVLLDTSARKLGFKAGGVPVGTLPSQSGLTATAGQGQVVLKVTRPNSSDYAGTLVVRKTGSTPTGPNDGTRLDLGTSTSYTNTGLSNGTTYYYRAFAYNSKKQYQTLITGATVSATPIVGIALSARPVGGKIRLSVGGTYYNFIIVNQGRPSTMYDTSCDGTWLLMEQLYEQRQWHSSNINNYANSTIKAYLDSTFYNKFDSSVRSIIKQVKIPYVNGTGSSGTVASGASGLSCKVFLMSACETGWSNTENSTVPIDGAKLSYFRAGKDTSANSMRIGYYNGAVQMWWYRSPVLQATRYVWEVQTDGHGVTDDSSVSRGIRPCIILPSTTMTKATPNADGSYDLQL